jgi:serine/threonine protein kinase
VNFFGWNEDSLDVYFAMEYIELGDLEKNLVPVWAETDTKMAIQQLLCGLATMHSHHITHRDLKPKVDVTSGLKHSPTVSSIHH